ncbi:MAG: glycosyltransferase [Bacteroidales bacterium]|nr:glycosyltransferase [Bacteroidales bacterium]
MTVDPSRFLGLKKESTCERYIAYCGAVSNYKDGVDVLIRAFSIVAKKISDINLYVIGGFPFKKDKEIDYALVNSLGLNDRVVFTGPIPREQMPQMLKNAEALVLSRPDNVQAKYGFPTKLGEYLLTENPVVLTRVGDIPKFLTDGESAFLAEPGDVAGIASKIEAALTFPGASSVGKMGASVALREFNSDIEAKKIIDYIYGKR